MPARGPHLRILLRYDRYRGVISLLSIASGVLSKGVVSARVKGLGLIYLKATDWSRITRAKNTT